MKYFSFIFISLFVFCSCSEPGDNVSKEEIVINMSSTSTMRIKRVEIDGEEFYATRTYSGYWVLGPRVKSEKIK